MRLYLSSYRLGDHIDQLFNLLGDGRRTCVVDNAVDLIPQADRDDYAATVYDSKKVLSNLGLEVERLDLRHYFGRTEALHQHMKQYDLVWVLGGNTFLLRRAMAQSGFDHLIKDMLKADSIVYGGFSAGVCVLAPTMRGIELMDEPERVADGYNVPILWDGLGIIDFSIVPHYQSPGHPETDLANKSVAYFEEHKMPYKALRDGDVLVANNGPLKLYAAAPK